MADNLGETLKLYRVIQGKTIQELSADAKVNASVISKIENGDTGVRLKSFLGLVRALGLELTLNTTDKTQYNVPASIVVS